MRNLLRAAFRSRQHNRWFIATFLTLIGLTIVNQLEMATLGLMANRGVEFFSLFGGEEKLSKEELDAVWAKIDKKGQGFITQEDVSSYVYHHSKYSPIKHFLERVKLSLQKTDNRMTKIVVALLLIAIVKAFFLFFSRYTTRVLAIKISKDLRQQYFSHIQTLSMSFYHRYNIGSLSTRVVGDANQIALSINSWVTNYLHTPFILFSTLVICLYLSWQLSLVIFVGVPLLVIPVKVITRKVRQVTRALQKNQENFASVLIDFLAGIQTVKIFSMESFTLKKYREQNEEMERLECRTNRYDLLTRPILHFVTTLSLVMIVFVGLYCLKMPLAELIVFCGLLLLVYDPVRRFADENGNVQRGIMAAERLLEVMSLTPEILDDPGAEEVRSFEDSLVFDRVWFRYGEEWVLKDVSFTVRKGETVAIVGATGSGKSTILQLIPRLYDVERGSIYLDGKPLDAFTQISLRSLIAYVPQKPFLFHDTIRANILYGQDIPDEEIIAAAKRAHAHEFITELPGQYDAMLLEMGKGLSGGQQQRLAIARALARKSPILILDEATSSLDGISERYIKKAIEELRGEMTQVIVAHRLSTIEHADKIIFIEKGIKIAEGTKEELLATCPAFRSLWEASMNLQPA